MRFIREMGGLSCIKKESLLGDNRDPSYSKIPAKTPLAGLIMHF
jgi:hypothetical protein